MDGGTRQGPGLACRSAVIALGTVVAVAAAAPAGAAEPGGTMQAPVSPVPTAVSVRADHVGGLDQVDVSVVSSYAHVGAASSSRACVTAHRSHVGTRSQEDREVAVQVVEHEAGCQWGFSDYRFDLVGWHAAAHGTVPTHVTITTYEQDAEGWEVVDVRESTSSVAVDLVWRGTGEERVEPWLLGPYPCYVIPPVCWSAGLQVSRDATVVGSVHFGGLQVDVDLPSDQLGMMHWRAGR